MQDGRAAPLRHRHRPSGRDLPGRRLRVHHQHPQGPGAARRARQGRPALALQRAGAGRLRRPRRPRAPQGADPLERGVHRGGVPGVRHRLAGEDRGDSGSSEGKIHWEDFDGRDGRDALRLRDADPALPRPAPGVPRPDGRDVARPRSSRRPGLSRWTPSTASPYEELSRDPDAWPAVYQNPAHPEIFAAGIAFAPPGPISVPHVTPNGTSISAAPPRTGMVSGIIGRVVALNLIDLVKHGPDDARGADDRDVRRLHRVDGRLAVGRLGGRRS